MQARFQLVVKTFLHDYGPDRIERKLVSILRKLSYNSIQIFYSFYKKFYPAMQRFSQIQMFCPGGVTPPVGQKRSINCLVCLLIQVE